VLIVGDNEIAAGEYSLKNMETGAQETAGAAQLYGKLSREA
jgi:histidyl-tRNA synthetase